MVLIKMSFGLEKQWIGEYNYTYLKKKTGKYLSLQIMSEVLNISLL